MNPAPTAWPRDAAGDRRERASMATEREPAALMCTKELVKAYPMDQVASSP